jgi:adenylate kinase
VRLILLGSPGAGKGSLAALIERRLGIPHISTGDIFRQEMAHRSALGRRVQRFVTSGRLVPDDLVVQVMARRLIGRHRARGFILDGFPRTVGQARGLDAVIRRAGQSVVGAIYLKAPRAVLVRRLSGRRVCSRCGANYHIRTMRPKRTGRCDRCQGPLIIRRDDQPATIRKRLAIDHAKSAPLLRYYRTRRMLHEIDGAGHIERAFERAVALCRRQGWLATTR